MKRAPSLRRRAARWLRAPFMSGKPLARRQPLDALWMFAARSAARIVAAYLRRGLRDAGAYIRGGIAANDGVFGFSDLDIMLVVPDHAGRPGDNVALVERRWEALRRRVPGVAGLVDVSTYEVTVLERDIRSPCLRCRSGGGEWLSAIEWRRQSGGARPRSVSTGSSVYKRFCVRPGLSAPLHHHWELIGGRDTRPAGPERDRADQWVAAWLELQWWWLYAFFACENPHVVDLPLLSLKLVTEPTRAWLWMRHGERPQTRREVLEAAIEGLPEEESLFLWALDVPRLAPPGAEQEILSAGMDGLVRLSARLAQTFADEVAPLGSTRVALRGAAPAPPGPEPRAFPLVDWRARVVPTTAEERFALWEGSASHPATVASAAAASSQGLQTVLAPDGLLVMPVRERDQAKLRGVQCRLTDPVSFALIAGKDAASFPEVPPWSASESARRAVAEHAAWLDAGGATADETDGRLRQGLGSLLSAARAALFQTSEESGAPELAITLEEVVARLSDLNSRAREVGPEALGAYRAAARNGDEPAPAVVAELRRVVCGLEPFARGR